MNAKLFTPKSTSNIPFCTQSEIVELPPSSAQVAGLRGSAGCGEQRAPASSARRVTLLHVCCSLAGHRSCLASQCPSLLLGRERLLPQSPPLEKRALSPQCGTCASVSEHIVPDEYIRRMSARAPPELQCSVARESPNRRRPLEYL